MSEPHAPQPPRPQTPHLRFITCGSVDDGKSTLIGRLLYECRAIPEDQLAALARDSARHGTQGAEIDFALLVDGLAAEREQGITIDLAYRYFSTDRRSFIVADAPGHAQYTRNMATGASRAELALLLVDARKGLLAQTRRHARIVSLLGVREVVLAVNKMDLVGHDPAVFAAIAADFARFAADLGFAGSLAIPVSALRGDNIVTRSAAMDWYRGPSLLEHLEMVATATAQDAQAFRMPVQWVSRPDPDFRGYGGQIVSGRVRPGDSVAAIPSGRTARVARIVTPGGDLAGAIAGQSVMLTLEEAIDVGRGDVLCAADDRVEAADQFQATILWMSDQPLLPGRSYAAKIATRDTHLQVTALRHRIDPDTGAREAARTLALNEIGVCNIAFDRDVAFAPYAESRALGGFILIDRESRDTVGLGLIDFALRRAANLHRQVLQVDRTLRAQIKGQKPAVLWFTGLSGAGKSTLANLVEARLAARGRHTYLLDGDNVRLGLNRDLGFTDADRVENIRRVGEVARLMADAGLIVLVAFISPFRAERDMARAMLPDGEFLEIFVDTPLAVAEARDVKGLYRKAREGKIRNFTGIDSPYEPPVRPEIRIDTTQVSAGDAAGQIIAMLEARGLLGPA